METELQVIVLVIVNDRERSTRTSFSRTNQRSKVSTLYTATYVTNSGLQFEMAYCTDPQ